MAIIIDEAKKTFHLQTNHASYLFQVLPTGDLQQLYYGARLNEPINLTNLTQVAIQDATPAQEVAGQELQWDVINQEYSSFGHGDFRQSAYQVTSPAGDRISEFQYQKYQLSDGKQRLAHLPSTFDDNQDQSQTLTIFLHDQLAQLDLQLNYTIFPEQDVIVRSAYFENLSTQTVQLPRALSLQLDLPDSDYDFLQFAGSWARERHLRRNHLHDGVQSISSLRTASSHQHNPFFILARPTTTNSAGEAMAFNFVYSGNFLDSVEVDQYQQARILVGINPDEFCWQLKPHTSFQTPEAILSYTTAGLNQLSQQLSDFYQKHLVAPRFAQQERPILINNWEATYFDFDETKLLNLADQAKDLGIELFVLDDGWFGKRDDDTTSLGDWVSDQRKLPQGVAHLAQEIHQKGLKFGLWFEPEMISLESQLYQQHPDWLLHVPGRKLTPGRHQYVLDLARPEVVDYLAQALSTIISQTQLDYVKWDMNRYITEMYSAAFAPEQQQELAHRYILGVYQLYERLTTKFPKVLFESCASGGGRFDLGMMYYAPQAWTSDDTDAMERLLIQYGTSFGYSLSMMGAHVSASPNEQLGRKTSLKTRGAVAYFGDLGYELDITQLTPDQLAQIKQQIQFYKHYRKIFQFGDFYRLQSPLAGNHNELSWGVVNAEQTVAIAAHYQLLNQPQCLNSRLKLQGLDPKKRYQINDQPATYSGSQLMNAGYILPKLTKQEADFQAQLLVIKAI